MTEKNKTDETQAQDTATSDKKKTRKKAVRKAIWILIPKDINDLDVEDVKLPEPVESPEGDDDTREPVAAIPMETLYYVYAVPGGLGQTKAVKKVLKDHSIDLRNIGRVKMFRGVKSFKIETQYNIRW